MENEDPCPACDMLAGGEHLSFVERHDLVRAQGYQDTAGGLTDSQRAQIAVTASLAWLRNATESEIADLADKITNPLRHDDYIPGVSKSRVVAHLMTLRSELLRYR